MLCKISPNPSLEKRGAVALQSMTLIQIQRCSLSCKDTLMVSFILPVR
jgi:hypothetical protein